MAQTQAARFDNIIDLTEGDDDDGQLETLSEAASKAQAAAARWKRHFRLMTSAPTVGQNGTLTRQNPPENKGHRPTANGVQKNPRGGMVHDIRSHSTGPKIGTFVPQGALHDDTRSKPSRSEPLEILEMPEIPRNGIATDALAVGSPKAAAQYPGRNATTTYDVHNPPEAQREARFLPPEQSGRPKLDQRMPKWKRKTSDTPLNDGVGKRVELETLTVNNPGSSNSRIHPSRTRAGVNESGSIVVGSNPTPQGKRKRSSTPPQSKVSAKSLKRETLASRNPSRQSESLCINERSTPSTVGSVTMQTGQDVREGAGSAGKRDPDLFIPDLANADPIVNTRQEVVLSRIENGPISEIFKTIVYPALKRAKKRASQSLSEDELMSIGKSVGLHYLGFSSTQLMGVNR